MYIYDEADLQLAVKYVRRMYQRITKINPVIQIKSDVKGGMFVVYPMLSMWCGSEGTDELSSYNATLKMSLLCRILQRACNKFHEAAPLLIEDFIDQIPSSPENSTPELCYYRGYFSRIHDEYWKELEWVVEVELDEEFDKQLNPHLYLGESDE
jgi:hypothetical protein